LQSCQLEVIGEYPLSQVALLDIEYSGIPPAIAITGARIGASTAPRQQIENFII